jgi:hypothetical protein
VTQTGQLALAGRFRLAFREFGLSIGLKGVRPMAELIERISASCASAPSFRERLELLTPYLPMAEQIEQFWLDPANQETSTWNDHREINMVMLSTSLAPTVFLSAA